MMIKLHNIAWWVVYVQIDALWDISVIAKQRIVDYVTTELLSPKSSVLESTWKVHKAFRSDRNW